MSKASDTENQKYWARPARYKPHDVSGVRVELWEHLFRGAITKNRVALREILHGLHEAMVHSDAIGHDCTSTQLSAFYVQLDTLIACDLVQEKDD